MPPKTICVHCLAKTRGLVHSFYPTYIHTEKKKRRNGQEWLEKKNGNAVTSKALQPVM